MAKKKQSFFSRLLRRLTFLMIFTLLIAGGYWAVEEKPELLDYLDLPKSASSVQTFELSLSPETLMQDHAKELVRTSMHTFADPHIQFSPLLLMHVKFAKTPNLTEEAICIWDQNTGEMVLDTKNFETTHGFEDCMRANASQDDFRVLNILSKHGGALNKELLAHELGVDQNTFYAKERMLLAKHLVVQNQDSLFLHFQNPRIHTEPRTTMSQALVEKDVPKEARMNAKYSKTAIQKLAQDAFGPNFSVRECKEIYLPVVVVVVENPDGSKRSTYFNGVTGKRLV